MARKKGKGRKRKGLPAHLRKYMFRKKGRKHMAKRRKHSKGRKHHKAARASPRRRRRHSVGGGGGGRGLAAIKQDVPRLLMAGVYGKVEALAAADANFVLNKVPRPLVAVGYTGNIALAAYLATFVTPNKYVRLAASVIATIATYKLGKNGAAFTDATKVGDDDYLGDEQVIDEHVMGALEVEAMERTVQPGLRYEDVVQDAATRV
jgi:hypothetical protein